MGKKRKEGMEVKLKKLWRERYPPKKETDDEWVKNYAKQRLKRGLI